MMLLSAAVMAMEAASPATAPTVAMALLVISATTAAGSPIDGLNGWEPLWEGKWGKKHSQMSAKRNAYSLVYAANLH